MSFRSVEALVNQTRGEVGDTAPRWSLAVYSAVNISCCSMTIIAAFTFFAYVSVKSCLFFVRKVKTSKGTMMKRAIRYLLFLHLNSVIHSAASLQSVVYLDYRNNEFWCSVQGLFIQFAIWNILLINVNIAGWILFEFVLIKKQVFIAEKHKTTIEIICIIFIVCLSTLMSALPLITNSIQPLEYWCWVSTFEEQLWYYYLWLWIIYAGICILYFISFCFLVSIFGDKFSQVIFRDQKSAPAKFVSKLIMYPLLFLLVWTEPTIHRVLTSPDTVNEYNFVLTLVHLILTTSYGFFSVFIYFLNPVLDKVVILFVQLIVKCLQCSKNRKIKEETEKKNLLINEARASMKKLWGGSLEPASSQQEEEVSDDNVVE